MQSPPGQPPYSSQPFAGQPYPGAPSAPEPAYPQGAYPQAGYPQAGYPQAGYPQAGSPQAGSPQSGYPQPGYPPSAGYPQPGGYAQPGYAQPGAFAQAPAGVAPVSGVRMSAGVYIGLMFGGLLLGGALTAWGATDSKVTELLAVSWVPMVLGYVANFVFIYKMWKAIDDGHARTTPGKAIGFLFIPLFNIYWAINIFFGYSTDYNAYVKRYGLRVPELPQSLFVAQVLLSLLFGPAGLVYYAYLISRVCKAVNALSPAR